MGIDAAGEVVAANPLANALLGDLSRASRRERTIPWRHFSGIRSRLERTPEEHAEAENAMAADLRDALGRFPHDEYLNELITDLRELSPRFAEVGDMRPVAHTPSRRKSFNHPAIGTITLDCDALAVQGSDLSVIVYTAPAGSPDAEALSLLGAIGLQSF
jgi:MmyB-like transcription regulator ligand binding domain